MDASFNGIGLGVAWIDAWFKGICEMWGSIGRVVGMGWEY
jgi:hypothetical protein